MNWRTEYLSKRLPIQQAIAAGQTKLLRSAAVCASMAALASLIGVLGLSMSPAIAAEAPIQLDVPGGGWNYSGFTDKTEDTGYAYPFSPIDRGQQTGRTLIRGQLRQLGKHRATIVVNGNPMPLYTDEQGKFVRPYVFGTGSNSIEILHGQQNYRMQFYEAKPGKNQAKMRIILAWDEKGVELDLHVLTPDGQHAFWAAPVLSNGGGMDVDSVDGAGPEMFSSNDPVRGLYQVYLNYWGNLGAAGYHFDEIKGRDPVITARVTLVLYENTGRERRQTQVVPVRKIGDLAKVLSFVF